MRASVLVAGGAGYIGSHVCKALAQAGCTPIAYDNLSRGHHSAVRWGPLVQGDIADAALLRHTLRKHDVGAVMHLAAFAYVGESMQDPGKYFRNNVAGTLSLLDAMLAAGVRRLVFSSTCATYGLPQRVPIDEDHPQRPVNPYGESKLCAERMLKWYEEVHGLRAVALRFFNAAGADPDGEIGELHEPETHLIPLAMEAALGLRKELAIYGTDYPTLDGTAIRDYIHVSDLAAAHVAGLRYLTEGHPGVALNLGTGCGHSVREVVREVERVAGHGLPSREAPRRPGDPSVLVASSTRATRLLGWRPRLSDLPTLVETAWRWHQRQSAGPILRSAVG